MEPIEAKIDVKIIWYLDISPISFRVTANHLEIELPSGKMGIYGDMSAISPNKPMRIYLAQPSEPPKQ